ncbi:MAG: fluoride efflux transporter CrcB [Gordonibacter sp.]|nr:fluoride efflux transporter CrcB [Gordonibacter sp.]
MLPILCVGIGGFLGSVARYLMGLIPYEGDFPLMTFLVNFIGAVIIGAVVEAASGWPGMPTSLLLFLKTGVCGGFTTFSTFSLETLSLLENGKYGTGAFYAGSSLVVCIAGVLLGKVLMRGARSLLEAGGAASV